MLAELPISELHPAKTNPRKVRSTKEQDAQLHASIQRNGLINPITVKKNGEGYEIVAGSRRFKAAKAAGLETVPVVMVDSEKAASVALDENTQRVAMHPADEMVAFKKALASGLTTKEIANQYAVSEGIVAGRLALANLVPEAIERWRKDEYDIGCVKALTLGTPEQQKQICESGERSAFIIRQALLKGGIAKSSRLGTFAGPLYEKRKLPMTADLFGDEVYYHDIEGLNDIAAEILIKGAQKKYGKGADIRVQIAHYDYPKGYDKARKDEEKPDVVLAGIDWHGRAEIVPLMKKGNGKATSSSPDAETELFSNAHKADIEKIRRDAWVKAVDAHEVSVADILKSMVESMLNHDYMPGSELRWLHGNNPPAYETKMSPVYDLVAYAFDPNQALGSELLKGFRLRDYWTPDADFFARMKATDIQKLITELIGVNPGSELLPDDAPLKRNAKKMKKADWAELAADIFANKLDEHLTEEAVGKIKDWEP